MPQSEAKPKAGSKRKRDAPKTTKPLKSRKVSLSPESEDKSEEMAEEVLRLEAEVLESRKHYNNIPRLLSLARDGNGISTETVLPAIALCRIFCRLFANGALVESEHAPDTEKTITKWLRSRVDEYMSLLNASLSQDGEIQSTALTLAMRVLKEHVSGGGLEKWQHGYYPSLVSTMLRSGDAGEAARQQFCDDYFTRYDDVRYFALETLAGTLNAESLGDPRTEVMLVSSALDILTEIDTPPEEDAELSLLAESKDDFVEKLLTHKNMKQRVQDAWLAVFGCHRSKEQDKAILSMLTDRIVPFFTHPELLMDYLTNAFSNGGATSLLALSGVFHLMQERNLDYPSFYTKLYSLLDDDLLHSKHRSRFFRLLDVFMSSTHLPAALVASFVKRLSRLALHAPPAGIVVVVPWIYNMFKEHPQCTFMIQRSASPDFSDPFDPAATNPLESGAIDSSIWEIETLQRHWHPNVATLARIISEQFTKQNYNLEDFLDHSYNSLVDAELGKEMKKTPVVEWEIPKHVFTGQDGDGLNEFGKLMMGVLETKSD